ncbi:Kelch repeat-containing protein [Peptostreptococcus faecalis]|uniref:hypothetical protein n=1 Tax=Peptostreptococcus faecalis TaxID=2045015 RepID=UPI000C7AB57C|nr:hypothetical protein [Peptostreptococcus faecalis]
MSIKEERKIYDKLLEKFKTIFSEIKKLIESETGENIDSLKEVSGILSDKYIKSGGFVENVEDPSVLGQTSSYIGSVTDGEKIYMLGMYTKTYDGASIGYYYKVYEYNTITNTWSLKNNLSYRREGGGIGIADNIIYYVGTDTPYDKYSTYSSFYICSLNLSTGENRKILYINESDAKNGMTLGGKTRMHYHNGKLKWLSGYARTLVEFDLKTETINYKNINPPYTYKYDDGYTYESEGLGEYHYIIRRPTKGYGTTDIYEYSYSTGSFRKLKSISSNDTTEKKYRYTHMTIREEKIVFMGRYAMIYDPAKDIFIEKNVEANKKDEETGTLIAVGRVLYRFSENGDYARNDRVALKYYI